MKTIHVLSVCGVAVLLSACTGVSYGNRAFNPSPAYEEQMAYDSVRVKAAERAERAEYRRERKEDMMDEADAIQRAYGTKTYNINKKVR